MSKIIIDMPNAKLKDAVEKKLAEETKYRGNGLADPWKCPACKDTVTDFPAISRKDNETEICSQCGNDEALADYFGTKNYCVPDQL